MATRGKKTLDANSAAEAVRAMANAAKPAIQPPAHISLRPGDEPFWLGVIQARATDEWTSFDLVVGAQLARTQHDIEIEQGKLDSEGTVIENARGTPVMNPRVTVLEGLARREQAFVRTLRMGGKVAGDPRDLAGKRKIEQQSRKLREELEDDELLA